MNTDTKRHIDSARQVLVGVVPNPTSQIDQITNALIYKFMDDMDQAAIKQGDEPSFFIGDLELYAWTRLMDPRMGNQERMNLYSEALIKFSQAKQLPELFRGIFKSAFLPYRSPETLGLFLKEIDYFDYSHPEELGNAYEYLLSIMSSQGDAGQFRTPRHIIDFIVDVVNPTKDDKVLDPACGTGGFLVSSYTHILEQHDGKNDSEKKEKPLTPDERKKLMTNFEGYDIDPMMVRIAQVNMYLHQFKNPKIFQYNTLADEGFWSDKFDVILANPPFMSPKGAGKPHSKFTIPSSRSEVLFVDYIMNHLRPKGRAGIIVPEGIIFQSSTGHKQLRKNLIQDGLYAVVSLPSGVFAPYSGVKTSILLFDIELSKQKNDILFIDIKNVGVSLGATQKAIEVNDLIPALSIIRKFQSGKVFEPNKLAFATVKQEIINNDYDLSFTKYKKRAIVNMEKPFVPLSDICSITKGKSSSTKTENGPYPLYLTAENYKPSDHFDFDGEGVAVPLISATGHGKAAINRVHFVTGKFALANLLAFLEPKNAQELNTKYLYHILNSSKNEMARLMKGAANVSMKTSDLEVFQIPLPSIEIQEQIVAELDGYAGIIAGAKQIAKNWKSKIEIDSEWETVKLGEVCELDRGFAFKSDDYVSEGVLNFRVTNIGNDGRPDLSNSKYLPTPFLANYKQYELHDGDFMIVMVGATTGKIGYITKDILPALLNQNMWRFLPNESRIDRKFLFFLVQSFNVITQGGAQGYLTQSEFIKKEIPLPPLAIQKQIVEKIEVERALVECAKKLITIYVQKTKEAITKLWME